MDSPRSGDVLVKRDPQSRQFTLVDATTREHLAGPFDRAEYAIGVAHSYAWARSGARIWGQSLHGSLEFLCSTPHTRVQFLSEMSSEPDAGNEPSSGND
jgi:hypothetical protein